MTFNVDSSWIIERHARDYPGSDPITQSDIHSAALAIIEELSSNLDQLGLGKSVQTAVMAAVLDLGTRNKGGYCDIIEALLDGDQWGVSDSILKLAKEYFNKDTKVTRTELVKANRMIEQATHALDPEAAIPLSTMFQCVREAQLYYFDSANTKFEKLGDLVIEEYEVVREAIPSLMVNSGLSHPISIGPNVDMIYVTSSFGFFGWVKLDDVRAVIGIAEVKRVPSSIENEEEPSTDGIWIDVDTPIEIKEGSIPDPIVPSLKSGSQPATGITVEWTIEPSIPSSSTTMTFNDQTGELSFQAALSTLGHSEYTIRFENWAHDSEVSVNCGQARLRDFDATKQRMVHPSKNWLEGDELIIKEKAFQREVIPPAGIIPQHMDNKSGTPFFNSGGSVIVAKDAANGNSMTMSLPYMKNGIVTTNSFNFWYVTNAENTASGWILEDDLKYGNKDGRLLYERDKILTLHSIDIGNGPAVVENQKDVTGSSKIDFCHVIDDDGRTGWLKKQDINLHPEISKTIRISVFKYNEIHSDANGPTSVLWKHANLTTNPNIELVSDLYCKLDNDTNQIDRFYASDNIQIMTDGSGSALVADQGVLCRKVNAHKSSPMVWGFVDQSAVTYPSGSDTPMDMIHYIRQLHPNGIPVVFSAPYSDTSDARTFHKFAWKIAQRSKSVALVGDRIVLGHPMMVENWRDKSRAIRMLTNALQDSSISPTLTRINSRISSISLFAHGIPYSTAWDDYWCSTCDPPKWVSHYNEEKTIYGVGKNTKDNTETFGKRGKTEYEYADFLSSLTESCADNVQITLYACNALLFTSNHVAHSNRTGKVTYPRSSYPGGKGLGGWLYHHLHNSGLKNTHVVGHLNAAHAVRNAVAAIVGRGYNSATPISSHLWDVIFPKKLASVKKILSNKSIKNYPSYCFSNKKYWLNDDKQNPPLVKKLGGLYYNLFAADSNDTTDIERMKNVDHFMYEFAKKQKFQGSNTKRSKRTQDRFAFMCSTDPELAGAYMRSYLYFKFNSMSSDRNNSNSHVLQAPAFRGPETELREWDSVTAKMKLSGNSIRKEFCLIQESTDGTTKVATDADGTAGVNFTYVKSFKSRHTGWIMTSDLHAYTDTLVYTKKSCSIREWDAANSKMKLKTGADPIPGDELCLVKESTDFGSSKTATDDNNTANVHFTYVESCGYDPQRIGWVKTEDLIRTPRQLWRVN